MGSLLRWACLVMGRRSVIIPFALTVQVVVFLALTHGHATAHGEGVEFFRGREGSYELVVLVQPERPTVGTVHFVITPLDLEASLPVLDAEIDVVAHSPEGKPAYQVRALNQPLSLEDYHANITFDSPGEWTLFVDVRHDTLGRARFAVPLSVEEQSVGPGLGGAIAWLAVLGVLVGGSTYLWLRSRWLLKQP